MPRIDRSAVVFSVNCFAAAVLALLIGFGLDLPRPYWSVLTVYFVSQPLAGAVRSKSVYRVLGTLLGAVFVVWVLPPLVNQPLLLSTVVALWVGLCLGTSLLDRTPRAYVVMLAGYTAALIGFPTVDRPEMVFDIATARVEEITLGILCAAFTHSLFFPSPVGSRLQERLTTWLADADAWALDLLQQQDSLKSIADRRHLAEAATEIHLLTLLLPFDTTTFPQTMALLQAAHHRLLMLIPVLSGIDDRLRALRAIRASLDEDMTAVLAQVADWVASGADQGAGKELLELLEARKRANLSAGDWAALLRHSLLTRLQELTENLAEAHGYRLALLTLSRRSLPSLSRRLRRKVKKPLHRDFGLAALSGLSSFLTVLLVCALWILTGWTDGGSAASLAGVFCALFAALDDPAPAIFQFGLFFGLAIPVAAFYQFAILPGIDGLPLLALFLAPPLLLGGMLMVDRRTARPALASLFGFISSLALQESYSANFAAFVNSNSAAFVALAIALMVTRTIRSLSIETAARRLMLHNWSRLSSIARIASPPHPVELVAELVDRIGLLTPKLAESGDMSRVNGDDVLVDLRIGMNLALIQQYRATTRTQDYSALTTLLNHVGEHFAALSANNQPPPGDRMLSSLDSCLADALAPGGDQEVKRAGIAALVGLRRNLFPDAPAFAGSAP